MQNRLFIVIVASLLGAACTTQPVTHSPEDDLGILWVKHAAEYPAITTQVYQSAEQDLDEFIADKSWTAMPGHPVDPDLPPAVILDVDETVVSNVDFQLAFERPFTNRKMYDFFQEHDAIPVAGVVEFVAAARAAGVTTFFVTNRPCEPIEGVAGDCPQKDWTIRELRSIGIETDRRKLSRDHALWRRPRRFLAVRPQDAVRPVHRAGDEGEPRADYRGTQRALGSRLVHPARADARVLDLVYLLIARRCEPEGRGNLLILW